MATTQQVKLYFAHWFQLGKKVLIDNGQESIKPEKVIEGNGYSQEFERCWKQLLQAQDCHLEGTEQSLKELLSENWELMPCARCDMPIPIKCAGISMCHCPCFDLPNWPNTELPQPRLPVDTNTRLCQLKSSLAGFEQRYSNEALKAAEKNWLDKVRALSDNSNHQEFSNDTLQPEE